MIKVALLKNTIQNYAWGSTAAIAELLGLQNPDGKPMAELWMGAHPKAPSQIQWKGKWQSLEQIIEKNPVAILGNEAVTAFGNRLPFLFKVLAADRPLSIQAHPNRDQARQGFERENRAGIPLDAFNRNYKDDNHKPEIICALSPFWAMCGFRQLPEIIKLIGKICPETLIAERAMLEKQADANGLKIFFTQLMEMGPARRKSVLDEAVGNVRQHSDDKSVGRWITRLSNEYPGDIGILAPALLNLIELKPGQALFLPAGELHAYLEGVGIELMANSDNVLRGGLTTKHVDVTELLRVLNFRPRALNILKPRTTGSGEGFYASDAKEFILSVVRVPEKEPYISLVNRSVEILLCTEGQTYLYDEGGNGRLEIKKGNSVIVPAAVKRYRMIGQSTFYKASVPIDASPGG